ncbi:MAG: hypothetical protein ABSF37_04985 [Sedimentisphaerales bacterium]|jgi:hypothetical protein
MRILLFVVGLLVFLAGGLTLISAQSSVGEIEGLILFATSAILISGAAIVEGTIIIRKELKEISEKIKSK